jgi:hypothetical protein
MPNPLLNLHSNAAAVIAAEDTLLAELPGLPAGAAFNVNGTVLTLAQALAKLTAHKAAFAACAKAKAALHEAVLAQQALRAVVQATAAAVRAYVVAIHGANSPHLATLGFAPVVRQEPSAATRALAAEKSRATRQARGTKGKRQRAAIHGTVPAAGSPHEPPSAVPLPQRLARDERARSTATDLAATATLATPTLTTPAAADGSATGAVADHGTRA